MKPFDCWSASVGISNALRETDSPASFEADLMMAPINLSARSGPTTISGQGGHVN